MKLFNKKGEIFSDIGSMGIGIATLAIVLTVVFLILSQARTQIQTQESLANLNSSECAKSAACNATKTLTDGVATIPGWVPLVVIAGIGSILLGLVTLFRRRG